MTKKEKREFLQKFATDNKITSEMVTKAHIKYMAQKTQTYNIDLQNLCDILLVRPHPLSYPLSLSCFPLSYLFSAFLFSFSLFSLSSL